jgi:hypothetical protein
MSGGRGKDELYVVPIQIQIACPCRSGLRVLAREQRVHMVLPHRERKERKRYLPSPIHDIDWNRVDGP